VLVLLQLCKKQLLIVHSKKYSFKRTYQFGDVHAIFSLADIWNTPLKAFGIAWKAYRSFQNEKHFFSKKVS